jgi:nucleotide-binding universal stress UspA family protein
MRRLSADGALVMSQDSDTTPPPIAPAPHAHHPFARVLACVALSPSTALVVSEARRLADACGSDLTFLHVGPDLARVRDIVHETLGPDVEVVARAGKPERVILAEAKRLEADLVFAGALRSDPLLRGILGSLARRLARNADRSLFLSIHRFPPEGVARTVVASIAFDDRSRAMLQATLALVRRASTTTLHIVREYDPHSTRMSETTGAGAGAERWEQILAAAQRFELANFLATFDLSGITFRAECIEGRGGEEVVRYAERVNADLLVIPAPERQLGFFDRFFGHPTETLLERFPCSVLLYRRPRSKRRNPLMDQSGVHEFGDLSQSHGPADQHPRAGETP